MSEHADARAQRGPGGELERAVPDGAGRGAQHGRQHARGAWTSLRHWDPAARGSSRASRERSCARRLAGGRNGGRRPRAETSSKSTLVTQRRPHRLLAVRGGPRQARRRSARARQGCGCAAWPEPSASAAPARRFDSICASCPSSVSRRATAPAAFVFARLAADRQPCAEREQRPPPAQRATERGVRLWNGQARQGEGHVPPAGRAGPFPSTNRSPLSVRMSLVSVSWGDDTRSSPTF